MASPTHLMPENGRYGWERHPPRASKGGSSLRRSFSASWCRERSVDFYSLARDEASGAHGDIHLVLCGKERRRLSPEEPPFSRPGDFSRRVCLKTSVAAYQTSYSGPSTNLVKKWRDSRTRQKTGPLGKHELGRARRAACTAGYGVG